METESYHDFIPDHLRRERAKEPEETLADKLLGFIAATLIVGFVAVVIVSALVYISNGTIL